MTILKCKMCGGDIQATDSTYGTCDSCGSTMTLPKASDDRKANLFNRANHYRRQNEFDKAVQAYENILNEDNSDAEAHWGLVLSRYGIEYVEDPTSGQMVPTCHRVQSDPILFDADFLATIEYALDEYTKSLYEDEAQKISDIQKGILAICSKEEPYDVFICYKETTDGGSRTKDSTIAQDIYYHLTNEGYKVFFSRITLEDKLGLQYEPYIFSALNSAKVMLVIGTYKEHFSAVWVKNEWSRYLALKKKNSSLLLIPCYKDLDPYDDLPTELSSLQGYDMSKVGFMHDLGHVVKKVIDRTQEKTSKKETAQATIAMPGVESLMKRGLLFLEDSDWKQANEYFDKVLDIDPEYAPGYLGKLCVDVKVNKEDELTDLLFTISENGNYKKAIRFADADYRTKIEGYNIAIIERKEAEVRKKVEEKRREEEKIAEERRKEIERKAEEKRKEAERLEEEKKQKYYELLKLKENAITEEDFKKLALGFRSMGLYENADKLYHDCNEQYKNLFKEREIRELDEKNARHTKAKARKRRIIISVFLLILFVFIGMNINSVIQKKKTEQRTILEIAKIKAEIGSKNPFDTIIFAGREWSILVMYDNRILIITKNIIEKRRFDPKSNIWANSEIRRYLNGKFYNSISASGKKMIGSHTTGDNIFLLSIEEVRQYFQSNKDRIAQDYWGQGVWWWLRSPYGSYDVYCVHSDGYFGAARNSHDHNETGGVRPALWLNLESK